MNVQPSIARATNELLVQPMSDCDWPTTNCYIDVWTLILNSWQLDPIAGLGFGCGAGLRGRLSSRSSSISTTIWSSFMASSSAS